jgi:hypothetical protein
LNTNNILRILLFFYLVILSGCCKKCLNQSDNKDNSEIHVFKQAKEYTCLILIHKNNAKGSDEIVSSGCGTIVKFPTRIGDRFFCLTANHVVNNYLELTDSFKIEILLRNNSDQILRCFGGVDIVRPVWRHDIHDLAILMLPKKMHLVGTDSASVTEIPFLRYIANPDSVEIGSKVCMLGYRYLSGGTYNYVLKNGIISAMVTNHPSFGNAMVFYVNQMANKGMSGGSVSLSNGNGLGIMLAYLIEPGSQAQLSDDLTVIVPYIYFFAKLKELAFRDDVMPDNIKENP